MRDLESRRAAVAFWTLLSAVVVTTLATVAGNLAPALLPSDACDACGYLAFGLIATAHAWPPAWSGSRAPPPRSAWSAARPDAQAWPNSANRVFSWATTRGETKWPTSPPSLPISLTKRDEMN